MLDLLLNNISYNVTSDKLTNIPHIILLESLYSCLLKRTIIPFNTTYYIIPIITSNSPLSLTLNNNYYNI